MAESQPQRPEDPSAATPPAAPRPPGTSPHRGRRALVVPALSAAAGVAILVIAAAVGQAISIGSALGLLLLVSAAVRFEIARRS